MLNNNQQHSSLLLEHGTYSTLWLYDCLCDTALNSNVVPLRTFIAFAQTATLQLHLQNIDHNTNFKLKGNRMSDAKYLRMCACCSASNLRRGKGSRPASARLKAPPPPAPPLLHVCSVTKQQKQTAFAALLAETIALPWQLMFISTT